jgi:hypothetical protein
MGIAKLPVCFRPTPVGNSCSGILRNRLEAVPSPEHREKGRIRSGAGHLIQEAGHLGQPAIG